MEAYAGRGAMEARARKRVNQGEKTALFRIMEERGRDRLSSGIWERALARDDHMAIDLLEEAVEALGAGVASAVNLLDPEAVVIGGGLGIRLGEPWVERIREAMLPHLFVDDDPPPVLLAELGDLGGAHGGALLAARRASTQAKTPTASALKSPVARAAHRPASTTRARHPLPTHGARGVQPRHHHGQHADATARPRARARSRAISLAMKSGA